MNAVIFAADPMPWAVKLIVANLAGFLLALVSGRLRPDGKVLAGPFFMACAAVTVLLHQLVWEDPGLLAIFGGFLVGMAVFLAAPSRKASVCVAIAVTVGALLSLGLTLFLRLPPREMRLAIARIRLSGGVVQQSDNPGTTFRDRWSVAFEPQGIDDDQLLRIAPDLRKLPKLWLILSNCSVGDRGLAGLSSAGNLIWLDLDSTQVTDAGLIHLSRLRGLERLNVARTRVSDTGLRSLTQLANLQTLMLHHTAVTENGVCELGRSLPDCDVRYGDPSVPAPANRENSLPAAESSDQAACGFGVYWPPLDPQETPSVPPQPLLQGTLAISAAPQGGKGTELRLAITLTRPSTEADRRSWNSTLAFADIAWMNEVRVWDADETWLWPNLPYLLRLPGQERVKRYGGMDPGKHVDNDFAAVLIRKYDASGRVESAETRDSPLVSAEWRAEGVAGADMHSIAHVARSDEFLLHVGGDNGPACGRLKVWLIYADFLGARAPRTWPKAREWAGGILAFFEVDWEVSPDHGCRVVVRHKRPDESTRFQWSEWVVRTPGWDESEAEFRLSDTLAPGTP